MLAPVISRRAAWRPEINGAAAESESPRETSEKISTIALTGMALVTIAMAKAMESTAPTLLATDEEFFDQHGIDNSASQTVYRPFICFGLHVQPRNRSARLAGGVDEGAHPLGRPQPVVELDRLPGLPDVRGDAPVLEHPQRLRAHAEPLAEALREHHRGRAALEQLLDVGRLDARMVADAGLVPVPGSRAAGEELGVC